MANDKILHLDDLDVQDFISAIEKMPEMLATKELHGVTIWIGLDDEGKFYTARVGNTLKSEFFYSEEDYPYFAIYNAYRGVHKALEQELDTIKKILSAGDTVEINVAHKDQDTGSIAFVRGVNGTENSKAEDLSAALNNKSVSVQVSVVHTDDGNDLDRKSETQTVKFVKSVPVKPTDFSSVNKELQKFNDFLKLKSNVDGLTNFEVLSKSLQSTPMDERDTLKAEREKLLSKVNVTFKLPIKKLLLSIYKIKSSHEADGDIDSGSVLLKDPESENDIRISNSSSESTLKNFNLALVNRLSGVVRSTDDDTTIENKGGLTGNMKIRISDVLGNKDLAITRVATKAIKDAGSIQNLADELNNKDFLGTKQKIAAIISATLDELSSMLSDFNKHKDTDRYSLKMKGDKDVKLSPSIQKRILLTFAETKRNISELQDDVRGSDTFSDMVRSIFKREVKLASADVGEVSESMNESLINESTSMIVETRNYSSPARYKAVLDAWTYFNIYIATVCMAVTTYKAHDTRGLRLLRDKAHYRMSKYSQEMSPLNFWGYGLWKSGTSAGAKVTSKKIAAELFKVSRKVPPHWVMYLHLELSFGKDTPINWEDHYKTMLFLIKQSPAMSQARIFDIVKNAFHYDTLSFDEKAKYLPKLYFYGQQFVPTSPLISRIRIIQDDLLSTGGDDEIQPSTIMTKGQKLLGEDGEIGAMSPSSSADNSTSSQGISTIDSRLGSKRLVVKRKRNPNIIGIQFKRPVKSIKESKMNLLKEISMGLEPVKSIRKVDLKNSDGSDAGSTDVINKVNSNDVEFSTLRNHINADGKVSGSDISNYLERAAEINDEVDTVPFGLETDDGDIVKVYVNADEADRFEEEMKKLLGVEDDIEEAINKLAQDFDIVDVVWPEDKEEIEDKSDDLDFEDLSDLDDSMETIAQFEPLKD